MSNVTVLPSAEPAAHFRADFPATTIEPEEIRRFTEVADSWWDPEGEFRPLHRLNPTRIGYIRNTLTQHFGCDEDNVNPFKGLTLCDVGCGGGLIAEPMTRLGFQVTAADAGDSGIAIAKLHAEGQGLAIDYRVATAETLVASSAEFDVVLALEIVEHVSDPALFIKSLAALLRPGGILIMSTLNRTLKSLALAKIGAEYVLRWVPVGTHDWRKFQKPSALCRLLRGARLEIADLSGLSYNPLKDLWSVSRDLDVNYMLTARKRA